MAVVNRPVITLTGEDLSPVAVIRIVCLLAGTRISFTPHGLAMDLHSHTLKTPSRAALSALVLRWRSSGRCLAAGSKARSLKT